MMYTGFFEVWPWWRLRHFERTHLLHLNTEMVMKRGFSVFRRWLCRKVLLYLQDNFPYPPPAQSFSYPSLMCQCFGVDSICDSTPHAISNLFFVGSHEMGQILSERYSLSGGGSNAEPFDWEADRHYHWAVTTSISNYPLLPCRYAVYENMLQFCCLSECLDDDMVNSVFQLWIEFGDGQRIDPQRSRVDVSGNNAVFCLRKSKHHLLWHYFKAGFDKDELEVGDDGCCRGCFENPVFLFWLSSVHSAFTRANLTFEKKYNISCAFIACVCIGLHARARTSVSVCVCVCMCRCEWEHLRTA